MQLNSLASGSSGNSIYVGGSRDSILVDVGISQKKIIQYLSAMDRDIKRDIKGILITHEHLDHVRGLGVISRKQDIPIYMTQGTYREVKRIAALGEINQDLIQIIQTDTAFWIGNLKILPILVSHDGKEPVAFRIEEEKKACGICTDLGCYSEKTIEHFQNLDFLFLEANHDKRMVELGPYPYSLKRRILGDKGHLSNEMAGRLLDGLLHTNMKGVILGHLSQENNYDKLALETVKSEIDMSSSSYKSRDFDISIAPREGLSKVFIH